MSDITTTEVLRDDQSHYEISLTAGQAFIAFVLMLLSLAASFAFGLMIGRGQADDRLVVRKEPAVINEGSVVPAKKDAGRIVDLAGTSAAPAPVLPSAGEESVVPLTAAEAPASAQPASAQTTQPAAAQAASIQPAALPPPTQPAAPLKVPAAAAPGPVYAQILSTTDQKTADALAAKLIDHGFLGSYVERAATEKGTAFRVRVRFASEAEARAAEPKLHEFSKDVWLTR
jgi:hypothetical protein